jgi:type I restriction enzyme S subunit
MTGIETTKETKRNLPTGWHRVKLGEVCVINPRRNDITRPDTEVTSFVPMEAVDAEKAIICEVRERPFAEVKKGYTYFEEGDVLFAKITPCMQNGKHAIARNLIEGFGFASTEFHVIRPAQEILAEWIHHFIRQPAVLQEATKHFTGAVGQQRVPDDYLESLEIPLPPLDEQQRISGMLHEQMAAVEKARAAAQARLEAVKTLPAAFLRQVFPQPGQPLLSGWRWVRLGEVLQETRNGLYKPDTYYGTGTRILKMFNIGRLDGAWDLSRLDFIELTEKESAAYRLEEGDILFNRVNSNELVGKCAVVDSHTAGAVYESKNMRLRPDSAKACSHFAATFLNSSGGRNQIEKRLKQSVGQATVNRSDLDSLEIPLPPFAEQRRIAGVLRQQMAVVEMARTAAEEELQTINALPAALLRRAFNGEV